MDRFFRIRRLIQQNKNLFKAGGIALLFIIAGIAFYIGVKGPTEDKKEEILSPLVSSDALPSPSPTPKPEISIPPQPTFKPKPKKSPSPSPSPLPSPSDSEGESSPDSSPSPSPGPS